MHYLIREYYARKLSYILLSSAGYSTGGCFLRRKGCCILCNAMDGHGMQNHTTWGIPGGCEGVVNRACAKNSSGQTWLSFGPPVMVIGVMADITPPTFSDTGLSRLLRAFEVVSREFRVDRYVSSELLAISCPSLPQQQTDYRAPVSVPATAQPHGQDTTGPAQCRQEFKQPLHAVTDLHDRASSDKRGLGAPHRTLQQRDDGQILWALVVHLHRPRTPLGQLLLLYQILRSEDW